MLTVARPSAHPSALVRVQSRGQITLPSEIRAAMGIESGDAVFLRTKGPGLIEIRVLPKLSLAELIERYPIEGPIDEQADREVWEAAAARDVIGRSV